jgi:hypothetical protein
VTRLALDPICDRLPHRQPTIAHGVFDLTLAQTDVG